MNAFGFRPAPRTAATASLRDWPTVSGTVTSPRETLSVTVEPCATCEPACGLCAITVPEGLLEATLEVSVWKPFARSALTAAASRCPTTPGTAAFCTAETVSVTTEWRTRSAPGFGS